MTKFNINWIFSVVVLIAAANLASASSDAFDLSVLRDILNLFDKKLSVLQCMERSCDPLAHQKMIAIENEMGREMRTRLAAIETFELDSLKADELLQASIEKLLLAEPKCHDLSYSCPGQAIGTIHSLPQFLNDYITPVQYLTQYGLRCVNLTNVQKALEILGKSIEYLENEKSNGGNYFEEALPAYNYVANEYRKLCDGNFWFGPVIHG
ncbi:uncharacterized protein LOC106092429 [Stomoxys calcitrans]|uniref:Uncharacterized protein n=1 Tax=Stomoxys calcitrans TaxID=35570 RepID=A0A1I8PRR7_STOCA|nr:uncharacterized protein LOC106092429 [Stomoxys calcitrans]